MKLYYKYYLEIKNRLTLLVLNWSLLVITCYTYKEILLVILIDLSSYSTIFTIKPYFIFTNVTEVFSVYLELTLFVANQLTLLMFFYHLLMFLSLGLYKSEFIKFQLMLKLFILSWTGSLFILYKFIVPLSWSFFLSFQESSQMVQPISLFFEAKINEYFQYFKNLYYICLINCQFLSFLICLITTLNKELIKVKTFRKLFYLIFVLFSTLMTPPDVISQILMSTFFIFTYEFLTFLKCLKTNMVTS